MVSWSHPLVDGFGEELLDGDAVAADEQRAVRPERRRESVEAPERIPLPAALHLDRREPAASLDDKIHLAVAVAPVEQLALAGGRGVRQVCADRRLDEPPLQLTVAAQLLWPETG